MSNRIYASAIRRVGRIALAASLVVTGSLASVSGVGASPVLNANPASVSVCMSTKTGTTSITWDVTGQISNQAILEVDYYASGTYKPLHMVTGKSTAPETDQVLYTGQPNFFALFSTQTGKPFATVRVDVQQIDCTTTTNLSPTRFLSSDKHYDHVSANAWCVDDPVEFTGHGSFDVKGLGNRIVVGFEHFFDPGTDPFPCQQQADDFYRGGVGYDMAAVNTIVGTHGLKAASLAFRQDMGNQPCIDHIGINSDPWETITPGSVDVVPDGGPALYASMTPLSGGGFSGQVDVKAPLALAMALNGGSANPHLHFVFVGKNEDIYAQDNNHCLSTVTPLVLQLVGDH
jgi:hypothetical protein